MMSGEGVLLDRRSNHDGQIDTHNKAIALSWIHKGMPFSSASLWSRDIEGVSNTHFHLRREILRRYLKKSETSDVTTVVVPTLSESSGTHNTVLELPQDVADFLGGMLQSLSIFNECNYSSGMMDNLDVSQVNGFEAGCKEDALCPGHIEIWNDFDQVKQEDLKFKMENEFNATTSTVKSSYNLRTPIDIPSSSVAFPATSCSNHSHIKRYGSKDFVLKSRIFECTRCPAAFKGSTSSFRKLMAHAKYKHCKEYLTLNEELRKKYKYSAIVGSGIEICGCSLCNEFGVPKI